MIKLINCDVDGTLIINYSDSIDPELFNLIDKFYEKGVLFFVATGRQLHNLQEIFKPVKDKIGYIAENGAIIYYKNEVLYESNIEFNMAKNLIDRLNKIENIEVFICCAKTTYVIPKSDKLKKLIGNEVQNHITIVKSFDEIKHDILKISIYIEGGVSEEIIDGLSKEYKDQFKTAVSGHYWFDFMKLDTHKGTAIKFLQNKLNINSEETMAFGDNFNDIEMLSDAKYSFAMENAHKDVKKYAKYTSKNVVETLREYYYNYFEKE